MSTIKRNLYVTLLFILSACGGEEDAGQTSKTAALNSGSSLPTRPIDLGTAISSQVSKPTTAVGVCSFASEEAVNAVIERAVPGDPFETRVVEPNECEWANNFGMFITVQRLPISDRESPESDRYNADIDPKLTAMDGPGSNAVMLADEILKGPYAYYFDKDGHQIKIRLTGIYTKPDKLHTFAKIVAGNSLASNQVSSAAAQSKAGPSLLPCAVIDGQQMATLFATEEAFKAGSMQDLSICEYSGRSNDGKKLEVSIKFSGDPLKLNDLDAYKDQPERWSIFSRPVYRSDFSSSHRIYGIEANVGSVIISVGMPDLSYEKGVQSLIENLVSRI